ncbi:MAG: PilZ domain-containing protein [Spirochaetales bacterium]|nr:PilZ domain-containing protein [Spirochaetales bacterium]
MNENSNKQERRGTQRIPAQDLPKTLRTLFLQFSEGEEYPVKTIDASSNGIALLVKLPVFSIKDFNITLKPKDDSFEIVDELVYIKPIDSQSSRVSIKFSHSNDLSKYNTLLTKNSF